jgi:hypothetical protein
VQPQDILQIKREIESIEPNGAIEGVNFSINGDIENPIWNWPKTIFWEMKIFS